jgi:hypothetical protein
MSLAHNAPILAQQIAEIAELSDPLWGTPPESWPDWCDDRWELGPDPYEPSADDRQWALENVDAEQDEAWAEYARWAEWYEQKMALQRMADHRYEADMMSRYGV